MTIAEPSITYEVPVTTKGVVRLPPELRERYLTPAQKNGECVTQSVGHRVYIWVWSERSNIRLEIDRDDFEARRSYEQSIHRWGINLNRYIGDGGLTIDRDGERPTVKVKVFPFDGGERP